MRLTLQGQARDLALFNLAVDSELRGCNLVALSVSEIAHGYIVQTRVIPAVQFLLGYRRLENTVRYLGIEVAPALEMAEQTGA